MRQEAGIYYVTVAGSCDYNHKDRAGGAAVVIEHDGGVIGRDVIKARHTTEFRMMLTIMRKVMEELPQGSDILFLTNVAYIQNFDKIPSTQSPNEDFRDAMSPYGTFQHVPAPLSHCSPLACCKVPMRRYNGCARQ